MASEETEFLPRACLDEVVLAFGLALRDILFSSQQEDDEEEHQPGYPDYMFKSACAIQDVEKLLGCCSTLTAGLQSVFGRQVDRTKRRRQNT
jgi:hypothetical protein